MRKMGHKTNYRNETIVDALTTFCTAHFTTNTNLSAFYVACIQIYETELNLSFKDV